MTTENKGKEEQGIYEMKNNTRNAIKWSFESQDFTGRGDRRGSIA
ncbi:MAG: hypothetical protein WD904_11645 [Dehalococcoidia bacterium]